MKMPVVHNDILGEERGNVEWAIGFSVPPKNSAAANNWRQLVRGGRRQHPGKIHRGESYEEPHQKNQENIKQDFQHLFA